ncbi:hypothetical protein [Pseudonocardia sp.]|uniref:hypothetical protein n=1 Tax=Pseudonocardia sp. TaxID=60912 RepID=UPI003D150EA6
MSDIWVVNPANGARRKIARPALGSYLSRGYAEDDDQTDPDPEIDTTPAAQLGAGENETVPDEDPTAFETPADEPEATTTEEGS